MDKWKIIFQLTPHFRRYWIPPFFITLKRWKSSDFSFGKFRPLFLYGNLSCFYWVKIVFYFQFTFTEWIMSRKFSPNFEGSLNLGFGVFSFYTLNYEQFRAPKRWAKSASFFLVIFCDEIIGSKNHRENSVSFYLLKSDSVNWCFVCKY